MSLFTSTVIKIIIIINYYTTDKKLLHFGLSIGHYHVVSSYKGLKNVVSVYEGDFNAAFYWAFAFLQLLLFALLFIFFCYYLLFVNNLNHKILFTVHISNTVQTTKLAEITKIYCLNLQLLWFVHYMHLTALNRCPFLKDWYGLIKMGSLHLKPLEVKGLIISH